MFGVSGLGLGMSGFTVSDLGFKVSRLGFRVYLGVNVCQVLEGLAELLHRLCLL